MSEPRKLRGLRVLPPMAIARFGSSPTPMENYGLELPVDQAGVPTSDYRRIVPGETLTVDEGSGSIAGAATSTSAVRFRDADGRIKPVSPFLEVWAAFEGSDELLPLTIGDIEARGGSVASLSWRVVAANLKVFRRTGQSGDKVQADTGPFSDHVRHALAGQCPNFKPGKSITFGDVRFIRPTSEFPEIRLRFTPGKGLVFGPRQGDPLTADDVYAGITSTPPARPAGQWDRYYIGDPDAPPVTAPGDIFEGDFIGVGSSSKLSRGFFDDTCDGIAEVTLRLGSDSFTAYGRFAAAVPDFAPDSLPVRSIADDLEQMALGPEVAVPSDTTEGEVLLNDVRDVVRRALDTMRQINTVVLNGNEPVADVQRFRNNMAGQETGSYNRKFEPVFGSPTQAKYAGALRIHKFFLNQATKAASFDTAFRGGIGNVRMPREVVNLDDAKRRLMPAMMRGNEGYELALTQRMIAKLALADGGAPAPVGAAALRVAPPSTPPVNFARATRPILRRVRVPGES